MTQTTTTKAVAATLQRHGSTVCHQSPGEAVSLYPSPSPISQIDCCGGCCNIFVGGVSNLKTNVSNTEHRGR